jgi:hypothetical protein
MSIAGQQFVRVPGLDNGHRRGDLSVELWDSSASTDMDGEISG